MFLNYCGSKCPHKCQEAEWYTSLHKRHTSKCQNYSTGGKKKNSSSFYFCQLLSLYWHVRLGGGILLKNMLRVWRGAPVRAVNVDNLMVISCCVQTSTGLFKCVKLLCDFQMVRTEVSGRDVKPNKVTWSCHKETKDTNGGKKEWCWIWLGLLHTCKSSSITKH